MWVSPIAAFLALPFVLAYDSIAQPATLTVIGQTLSERHRTLAISLQSIQRRIPRIIAYLSGGALVSALGAIGGVRAAVAISSGLAVLAIVAQMAMLHSHTKDSAKPTAGFSLDLLRRFPPELKRLLISDILARVAEGMPRELYIIAAVAMVAAPSDSTNDWSGFGVFGISTATFGVLLAIQAFTSLALYIPIGWIAARPGAKKQPFIG